MNYAELLWVDRLGMYVRVEAAGHLDGLVVSAQGLGEAVTHHTVLNLVPGCRLHGCPSTGQCWMSHVAHLRMTQGVNHTLRPVSWVQIARVPFYRPVLDERDARSVITMAAQLAWEEERP